MEVQGHRGAGILVPENTMASFKYAVEHGYQAVEMDLWMTKDKHAVVIHGGKKDVPEPDTVTLSELRAECDETAPLLKEVLDFLSGHEIIAQLELKGPLTDPDVLLKVISDSYNGQEVKKVQLSGFDSSKLLKMKELAPHIPRSLTFHDDIPEDWLEQAKTIDPIYVDFRHSKITEDIVKKANDNGLKVMAWFPGSYDDTEDDLKDLIRLKVDRVCANRPDKLQMLLQTFTS